MSVNIPYWICAQCGLVPLAIGAPGVAKTASAAAFAKAIGAELYVLIGSLREPADIGGYPYPTTVVTEHGERVYMRLVVPEWVHHCWGTGTRKRWVILIDELTCCPPAVQAALLRVIAERYVGDTKLPDDVIIITACNPPGMAANGVEIEPPMANRMGHFKWEMDWESWDTGMMNGLDFPTPKFPLLPDDWRDNIPKVGTMISAFRRKRPSLFEDAYPKDRAKASGPWPSARSWTHAAIARAAGLSVNAEPLVLHTLLEGFVGYEAANEFTEWEANLDLPDPEELLDWSIAQIKGKPIRWPAVNTKSKGTDYVHPDRSDKVIAMLGSVAQRVLAQPTVERWEAALSLLAKSAEYEVDVALSCVKPLANPPKGATLPKVFVEKLYPSIRRGLIDN